MFSMQFKGTIISDNCRDQHNIVVNNITGPIWSPGLQLWSCT